MKFSICTDSVFRGIKTPAAMKVTKEAGHDAIEFWSWRDKDTAEIKRTADGLGMEIAAICTDFITMLDEKKRDLYLDCLRESAETACGLGCGNLITQVGDAIPGVSDEYQFRMLEETLSESIPILHVYDVTLLIEPLNTLVDHRGYFLSSSGNAFKTADRLDDSHIRVLFDIYHQLVSGEDPYSVIPPNIGLIGHFHCAGYPGRNEISGSGFDYKPLFEMIGNLGYNKYMGIEYVPTDSPEDELRDIAHGITG